MRQLSLLATAVAATAAALAVACAPRPIVEPPRPQVPAAAPQAPAPEPYTGPGIRVAQGAEAAQARQAVARPPSTPLPEARTSALLARLPPLATDTADQQPFALRASSLPPPRTGRTVAQPFPPPRSAEASPAPAPSAPVVPLKVLRQQPVGEVPLAPQLSVTFSEPMVAVTSHGDLAKEEPPVKLVPEPKGTWRWLGTRTLLFDADPRFPMATEYQVEVPAGTRSATGAALAGPERFGFATPPAKVLLAHPSGRAVPLHPVLIATFDQRIEPGAVLQVVKVEAGGKTVPVHLASPEELAADEVAGNVVRRSEPGRVLALRTDEPLPKDTQVTVTLGPGLPSAEGPRKNPEAHKFSFRTYAPLRVDESRCGWGEGCEPGEGWQISFNNPLDAEKFDPALVTISPPLRAARITVSGDDVRIQGLSRGRTKYTVGLDPSITDRFAQQLGATPPIVFEVGPAQPALFDQGGPLVVLDPSGPARWPVYAVNQKRLRVRLYAVRPEDFQRYLRFLEKMSDEERVPTPPGRLVQDRLQAVKAPADELVEVPIDLAPALPKGLGHVVAFVEPERQPRNRWERRYAFAWVEVTKLGLSALWDEGELHAWASSLADGAPLADAEVTLVARKQKVAGRTGSDGVSVLALPDRGDDETTALLLARAGDDTAFLPEDLSPWGGSRHWNRSTPGGSTLWYVFDDRKLYRPGEELRVKGFVRRHEGGKRGDLAPILAGTRVRWKLRDSRGNRLLEGEAPVSALGGFTLAAKLSDQMNLGGAAVELRLEGAMSGSFSHRFQVEEFRRPEFEVGARASEGPHVTGGSATLTVTASYFAGGGLPDAPVRWAVTTAGGHFTPPGREEFSFGGFVPWWRPAASHPSGRSAAKPETFEGRTDASGAHRLRVDFGVDEPPFPRTVTAQATVTDVNRQAWAATSNLLVHPATTYVGLKTERAFVEAGQPVRLQAIAVDLDGKAVPGRKLSVTLVRKEWVQKKGKHEQVEVDPQTCEPVSAKDPVACELVPKEGGAHELRAEVLDERGRRSRTELTVWVAGGKLVPDRSVTQQEVLLVPDRKEYRPGDVAELLVQAPFEGGHGQVTVNHAGILRRDAFRMEGASHTIRVPIEEAHLGGVEVRVDLAGAGVRFDADGRPDEKLPKRPAFAAGSIRLPVPPRARALAVQAAAKAAALEPGADTTIDVSVADAQGRGVPGAEVAVVVVDEAVLALTGYKLDDILDAFHPSRAGGARELHQRAYVLLSDPAALAEEAIGAQRETRRPEAENGRMAANGHAGVRNGHPPRAPPSPKRAYKSGALDLDGDATAAGKGAGAATPIRARLDFSALALFAPAVVTDKAGRAAVPFKLPDNLTRYRVMAVAVAGVSQFGQGESTVTARLPLMVRPSPPRFLNFGDRFELPVVLQNQTERPLDVEVAARAGNAGLDGPAGLAVRVPANDRVEVRFPASARSAGTARFQLAAAAGRFSDAATIQLPVWTPATTEAFAVYGELDEGAVVQPVALPTDAVPQFGGLSVETSSTQLQALTDAVVYLVRYPYECVEQRSSRVIAIAALKDVLSAFQAEGLPPPKELQATVDRDIARIVALQAYSGGFSFWKPGGEVWPWPSVHAMNALLRAKQKGFAVPDRALERGRRYLRDIESHIPAWYGRDARRTVIAYALSVRGMLGDRHLAAARKLIREAGGVEGLPLEALGFILPLFQAEPQAPERAAIRRHVQNRATETAGAAHFVTDYGDHGYVLLHSDRRADGILLDAMIADEPGSDLVPKVVRGLLGHRKAGRWSNTQENSFVLLALDRYFQTYEKATPDFVARLWLGEALAGEQRFQGRSTDRLLLEVPMSWLAERPGKQDLLISKEGPGRLYYRIGMKYAPKDLWLSPADHGFVVERRYEAVDDPAEVRRDADGTWRVRSGARVRVRLSMLNESRRTHVALVDPLPAGLEPMSAALAPTGAIPQDPKKSDTYWWWRSAWYEHQNLRDERVEAFASLVLEGVREYTYVARATTPGQFVVPPAKAEEMYHPETFGRSGSDRVVVE